MKLWRFFTFLFPRPGLWGASTTPPFGHRLPRSSGCSGGSATLTERSDNPACKIPVSNTYLGQNTTTSEASEQNAFLLHRIRARQARDEHPSAGGSQRSREESRAALQGGVPPPSRGTLPAPAEHPHPLPAAETCGMLCMRQTSPEPSPSTHSTFISSPQCICGRCSKS